MQTFIAAEFKVFISVTVVTEFEVVISVTVVTDVTASPGEQLGRAPPTLGQLLGGGVTPSIDGKRAQSYLVYLHYACHYF